MGSVEEPFATVVDVAEFDARTICAGRSSWTYDKEFPYGAAALRDSHPHATGAIADSWLRRIRLATNRIMRGRHLGGSYALAWSKAHNVALRHIDADDLRPSIPSRGIRPTATVRSTR